MAVQYVRVRPLVDMFSPRIRATGNVAIIGTATGATDDDIPVQAESPSDATAKFGAGSDLTRAIQAAFRQTPGPSQVWGVKQVNVETALKELEKVEVQFVALANTALNDQTAGPPGAIGQLSAHVTSVSNAGDGRERMGVAMLAGGVLDRPSATPNNERMVYVAHNSPDEVEVAAAVAGTIAGYDPHVSMVLKQVAIDSKPFSSAQIGKINGDETENSGPAGKGVIWLDKPALLPGGGVYLGEGYTGNAGGDKKYIDIVRAIDDISFKIKARLIRAIGNLRISRSGLRGLSTQLEVILNQSVADGVIEGYDILMPILTLLDADPQSLTVDQRDAIDKAQINRVAQVLVSVDYAGAMHRINVDFAVK
jgi:hypothetical protein